MALHQQEKIIVTIAKMLADKQLEPEMMKKILLQLCEIYAFDCALLYEAERHRNRLKLLDCCRSSAKAQYSPPPFLMDFDIGYVQDSMLYCNSMESTASSQNRILSLLNVQSAATAFMLDENGSIYGLLALCNLEQKPPLDTPSYENLKAVLAMLSRNTAIRTYQSWLRFSQTALESILDNTGIDIYVNDFYTHEILYVNESMAVPYGGKTQFAGRKCWQVLFPGQSGPCEFCPQKNLIDENGNPSKVYTWDYQRSFDGSWFRVFSAAFRWEDGRLAHVVSSADITDNKHSEEMVRYLANYDALTNLPNRRMLVSECERRINQVSDAQSYVLFFDIDGFKKINDTLGHEAGDEFLIELGKFFINIPLLKDSTYRNGGDEFVAMLGDGITPDNVRDLSRFIQMRFNKPWNLKNGAVKCGISIGVARYPDDGVTAEELLHKADQAMYFVKKNGGGGVSFAGDYSGKVPNA